MGNNGGEPHDTILTLEDALRRFARKRAEGLAHTKDKANLNSKVRYADFSASDRAAHGSANAPGGRDEAEAGKPADKDFVAVIGGIPRTLEELEQIAVAEGVGHPDFPVNVVDDVEVENEFDGEFDGGGEIDPAAIVARHALIRDYAFTAMGTALMALVAGLVMRVPIVSKPPRMVVAQSIATPALKASSPAMGADDLITTLVIIPDTDVQMASAAPKVESDQLEAQIKDRLKSRAFPDIGVSVSQHGDAYLAGEVYSLDEARKISRIVHRVSGVNRVHFLHPNVKQAQGPAYFGVKTASSPAVWGAKVQTVAIGSPADKAGIKAGDVISEFDGKTIPDARTLKSVFAQYTPGQRVEFRVWHQGQPEYLVARLGEQTTLARI